MLKINKNKINYNVKAQLGLKCLKPTGLCCLKWKCLERARIVMFKEN